MKEICFDKNRFIVKISNDLFSNIKFANNKVIYNYNKDLFLIKEEHHYKIKNKK